MNITQLNSIDALEAFIAGNQAVAFEVLGDKSERYQFVQKALIKFNYLGQSKKAKGIITQYLHKVTGYSRQQLTRLIKQYRENGRLTWSPCRSNGFKTRYDDKDIRLLAEMDERYETPCGHAIKKLCERAYDIFKLPEYKALATISVSHIYNLRASKSYKKLRRHFTKTQPRQVPIGERRKPFPNGKPGYIRIDTVHQGDMDKRKGVYHINAVDEITQFEVVCSVEKISERFLLPVLELLLDLFPFTIEGFH